MQEENAKNFAERLRALISDQPKSKKFIAEKAGIHPVTLSKYLAGKRIPATNELHSLASVLRVTSSWLLTGEGDPVPVNLADVLANSAPHPSVLQDAPYQQESSIPWLAEIVKLSASADLSQLLDTMESLSKNHPGDPRVSNAVGEMAVIVRNRLEKQSSSKP